MDGDLAASNVLQLWWPQEYGSWKVLEGQDTTKTYVRILGRALRDPKPGSVGFGDMWVS